MGVYFADTGSFLNYCYVVFNLLDSFSQPSCYLGSLCRRHTCILVRHKQRDALWRCTFEELGCTFRPTKHNTKTLKVLPEPVKQTSRLFAICIEFLSVSLVHLWDLQFGGVVGVYRMGGFSDFPGQGLSLTT